MFLGATGTVSDLCAVPGLVPVPDVVLDPSCVPVFVWGKMGLREREREREIGN